MKKIALVLSVLFLSIAASAKGVDSYKVKVVAEYPHDTGAYTQGLFFHGGKLYESTGQYGESTFRLVDLASGRADIKVRFAKKYFGEGSVILGNYLYVLTWTNKVLFVYDAVTLRYLQTYSYPREGWGLTTDGTSLIASDGSSNIYFMSPDLRPVKTIKVTMNGRPVRYLNELEWIDGKIWANVYQTDIIVIINPYTGNVEATVDCTGLLPEKLRRFDTDVLNGIAKDPRTGKIYLTGKNWPRLYEIQLERKKK